MCTLLTIPNHVTFYFKSHKKLNIMLFNVFFTLFPLVYCISDFRHQE